MKPIFLIHGFDWTRRSAGIRSLHKLAELLSERGEDVYMSPCKLQPLSKLRIWDDAYLGDKNIVVIEPEINSGQPRANLTVRWLLNTPGKTGDGNTMHTWSKDDLLAHFDEAFSLKGSIPLCVPHVDRTFFNNDNNAYDKRRDLDCFYAHKALFQGFKKQIPLGAFDVSLQDGNVCPGDWETLREIFRRTRTFYTMEDTAASIEAALCGAKVEYILSDYQPEPPDITDFVEWYANLERRSSVEIDNFVNVCYDRLGLYATA